MKSAEIIIIQTALRPMCIAYQSDGKWSVTVINAFHEFFEAMDKFEITSTQKILVNRGPGSYSGIRTGIAYAYGLLHGGVTSQENIITYTAFALIAPNNLENGVYFKGWPRLATGTFADSKGYYLDSRGEISYISYEQLPADFNGVLYAEEEVKGKNALDSSILQLPETFENLWKSLDKDIHTLEPLYVNPVHITSK